MHNRRQFRCYLATDAFNLVDGQIDERQTIRVRWFEIDVSQIISAKMVELLRWHFAIDVSGKF